MNEITWKYVDGIREAMHKSMSFNESVFIFGQGVRDHKAIFGSISGLLEIFDDRIIETPIAEESITGVCLGAATNGIFPILTHIRADFGLLAMNQMINMYSKYKYMYGGQFQAPGLIRFVIGRSWGQGAQHSQSLHSILSHFPGVHVILPSNPADVYNLYTSAVKESKGPVFSFEHRLLYDLEFPRPNQPLDYETSTFRENCKPRKIRSGVDLTIVATSIMVLEAIRAADFVQDQFGISCEVFDIRSTTEIDLLEIGDSLQKTQKLVVADVSWGNFGLLGEILRRMGVNEMIMPTKVAEVVPREVPCPTAKELEDMYYPSLKDFVKTIGEVLGKPFPQSSLPTEKSFRDYYSKFKGPF